MFLWIFLKFNHVNYRTLFEIKIKEHFQKRQALNMWLKSHKKDFLRVSGRFRGCGLCLFGFLEHLEASGVRLLCLLRFQRIPLKRFQIENHSKTRPLNPYFPEGLKRPGPRPQKAPELSNRYLVLAFSTCLVHIISIVIQKQKQKHNQGHRNLKAFYGLHCSLEFLGVLFPQDHNVGFFVLFCFWLLTYSGSVLGTKSGV